jgi:hypothetical protein
LGLENPERYTSHCLKRTTITMLADYGLSLPQIKSHSGHKSDTVVSGYIAASLPQKRLCSKAIELEESASSTPPESPPPAPAPEPSVVPKNCYGTTIVFQHAVFNNAVMGSGFW